MSAYWDHVGKQAVKDDHGHRSGKCHGCREKIGGWSFTHLHTIDGVRVGFHPRCADAFFAGVLCQKLATETPNQH